MSSAENRAERDSQKAYAFCPKGSTGGCWQLVALEVERRMDAKDVIRILDEAVLARGCVPEFIRSDNGPEFIAVAVQDWIARRGFKTLYIKPGAPWQNAYGLLPENWSRRYESWRRVSAAELSP